MTHIMKLFYLILLSSIGLALAQEGASAQALWPDDILLEEEAEIACPDLPSVFSSYMQDVSAGQTAAEDILLNLEFFLQADQQHRFQEGLAEQIQSSLEAQRSRVMQDQMNWSFQFGDISYFTQQCLKDSSQACKNLTRDLIFYNQDITVNQSALGFSLSYVADQFQELQERPSLEPGAFSIILGPLTNARSFAKANRESLSSQGLRLLDVLQMCLQ